MNKEFIPYEQALALKELGFDEPCIQQYSYDGAIMFCVNDWGQPRLKTNKQSYSDSEGDCISAPTFSQAFRWFREKYNISSFVKREFKDTKMTGYYHGIEDTEKDFYSKTYITYEEAELECLKELIEIVNMIKYI
jgi:hypothetical protein